jgi:hypothetical protein
MCTKPQLPARTTLQASHAHAPNQLSNTLPPPSPPPAAPQVWMITIQFFECLNVATQALCSSYLGAGDVDNARGVINRVMFMGCSIGAIAGAVVFGFQDILVGGTWAVELRGMLQRLCCAAWLHSGCTVSWCLRAAWALDVHGMMTVAEVLDSGMRAA